MRQRRPEWMREVELRQRNIVYPDTLRNEVQFWRNLLTEKDPHPALHIVGLLILALVASFFLWIGLNGLLRSVLGVAYLVLVFLAFMFLRGRVRKALFRQRRATDKRINP